MDLGLARTIAGSVFFASFVSLLHPAWSQAGLYQYRLSTQAIKCLVEHRTALESMNRPTIVLNVGLCPPSGLTVETIVSVQNNPVPSGKIRSVDDKVVPSRSDSIVFLSKAMIPCFLKLIETLQRENDEIVLVDLSSCRS